MFNLFLTQGGGLLGIFERPLGWILNLIYELLSNFGIESVALSIIFFTMIVKTLMLPLTIRQQKFQKLSSAMNPEIMEVQSRYKGKKDEVSMQRQQRELQEVYDKYGSNPSSGCLPLLVTLPIMMGLYRVIYKIPAYIEPIKELYTNIATGLKGIEGSAATLVAYGEELTVKISDFTEYASEGILTLPHTIDILSKFKAETWTSLATDFPAIEALISSNASDIIRVNTIPGGINLLENPGFMFPGILIPILATLLQVIQTRQIAPPSNANSGSDNPAMASMNSMTKIMPLMSGVFCIMLPTGVGLYWIANSFFTIIQQFFINRYMNTADIDAMVEKNKEKVKKKEEKIGINKGSSFADIANSSTKSINADSSNSQYNDSSDNINKNNNNTSASAGSISDYANIMKNRNKNKGDK